MTGRDSGPSLFHHHPDQTTPMTTLSDIAIASGISHLQTADSVMGSLIDRIGPCTLRPQDSGTHFDHVARAIVYQQLSGRAAGTIYSRFLALYGGDPPTPYKLRETDQDTLRSAGLSRPKISYLRDLAERCLSGELQIDRLHELDDETVIEQLTSVKGIGRWTAQMFLLFRLGRPDVLSELDLGIRKAIQNLYSLPEMPPYSHVAELGERWSPYRSIASWYLWRSLD